MKTSAWLIVELLPLALTLGFSVWVLGVQPLVLVRKMPKPKFLGLQMLIVRAWARTLVPLTGLAFVFALVRTDFSTGALYAGLAFVAAIALGFFALPRALRAGSEAVRAASAPDAATSAHAELEFLVDGGGEVTKFWHRVVLAFLVLLLAGAIQNGVGVIGHVLRTDVHRAALLEAHHARGVLEADADADSAGVETTAPRASGRRG